MIRHEWRANPGFDLPDVIQHYSCLREMRARAGEFTKGRGMPDDLTPMQRSVLLLLMAEAREVPNAELTNKWKLSIKRPYREDLVKRGFITVRQENRRFYFDLADSGAVWCGEQNAEAVPAGMGSSGAAAYALLAGVRRYVDRAGISLGDFFARTESPVEPADDAISVITDNLPASDLETRVRKAYGELATRPGSWVKLSDLRPLLGDAARAEVDRTLVLMNRTPEVTIAPESDQMSLTERDRAAAVWIGNQEKHVIAIGSA